MQKIKVGIIGTGNTIGIAGAHMKGYTEIKEAELTSVYDVIPGKANDWLEKHKVKGCGVTAYNDPDSFLDSVDAVSICTPNSEHVKVMEPCLAAGKHVITEKPLSSDLQEAQKALDFDKKYPELVKMIVFNYREKPGIAMIKHLINEGKLGRIHFYRYILGGLRIADPENVKLEWRMQKELSGTGAMADFGCHMLDLADFLLRDTMGPICNTACFSETFVHQRHAIDSGEMKAVTNDDTAVIIAKTEKGALCSLTASRLGIPREMIEVCGDGGTIAHNLDEDFLSVRFKPANGAFPSFKEEILPIDEKYKRHSPHGGVLADFINCIQSGKQPDRSLSHGYYIQTILSALEESSDKGKMVLIPKAFL